MVFLTAPSGGTTFQIEIDIMELGITANPFGESQAVYNKQGKQRLKYGTVALTISLRSGSSGIPRISMNFLTFWIITPQAFIVRH